MAVLPPTEPYLPPPCQICTRPLDRPGYVGRVCDFFTRPSCRMPTDSQSGKLPSPHANWAEFAFSGSGREPLSCHATTRTDTRACLIAANGLLCYKRRGSTSEEEFRRVHWNKGEAHPYAGSIGEPQAMEDTLPFPVIFPLCSICIRLVRNHVSHWNSSHPYSGIWGYDALFVALSRRLLSLSSEPDYIKAFYTDDSNVSGHFLGSGVIIQASPASAPFKLYDVPSWSRLFPYNMSPRLPRWMLSKLKRIEDRPIGSGVNFQTDGPASNQGGVAMQEDCAGRPTNLPEHVRLARDKNRSNKLCSLPGELLYLITVDLDRNSLFSLRMAATDLAYSRPLDQAFWYRELLYADVPLFGFEPLSADSHTHIRSGTGMLGRIDAFSEIESQFRPLRSPMFDPVKARHEPARPGKLDWRKYDWKSFVRIMGRAEEFLEGGACDDAPTDFRARRWLWGQLDRIFKELGPGEQ